ncbi:Peptidase inhibitor I9 [Bhargavaea ginsengi]|uniref:Peptidase inhibitor I9 n=1 Tax=Bhargavaea ginsengi TaxID=426757 RepID=A0A1H7AI65_9BACL|nr:S8 family serine peptidase [Bhargavaea ginsengi]SEJ63587.1 Peptidase inhibitor I9 [Bhargavaea ginsengi]
MEGTKRRRPIIFMILLMVLSLILPTGAFAELQKPATGQSDAVMQQKMAIAMQDSARNGLPQLHPDLRELEGQQEVNVIIQLSEEPIAVAEGKKKLKKLPYQASERAKQVHAIKAEQQHAKKTMNAAKLLVKEGYAYETVLNGFAATVKADDLEKLLDVPGVKVVEPDVVREAMEVPSKDGKADIQMDSTNTFLGIERLWNERLTGEGIKVGVLDTGIDYHHPDFSENYAGGWNFVPDSSDYARPRDKRDPMETTPLDRPNHKPEFNAQGSSFYTSHGTHVAGTIAAAGNNEYGIKGIAPDVELHAYRVLGAYGSGATSWIIAAIEQSVEDGMDVINLSLGGGGNTSISADSFAINNAMLQGTIAVVATGNSGPNRGTMGTPATATLGIAVGNTTKPEETVSADVRMSAGEYHAEVPMNLMATTFGADTASQLEGEFAVVAIPGTGSDASYTGLDVNGKVALVSRGDIPFVDKIAAAKKHGAAAVLIHNFAGGTNAPDASGTYLGSDFEYIPTFDMSQTDGEAFRSAIGNGEGTVTFGNVLTQMSEGDQVNDSSSRGPSTPDFDIKPDVTAPGTNIMSAIPAYKTDVPDADYSQAYARKTGTSMATPHIAGIAALVQQANPGWTPFDVKVSLSNTAKLLDTKAYDVFSQGAGRVQPYEAAFPEALAYSYDKADADGQGTIVDNIKGTITFGKLQQVAEADVEVSKTVKVKDVAGAGGNYTVTVQTTKAFGDAAVTVDKSNFTLNGEEELTVTLTAPQAEAEAGDELLGYVHITGPEAELSLPFAASFGPDSATAIEYMDISGTDLSFNGDGVNDSALLSFKITGDLGTNYIELWDIQDPEGGPYGDGYIGYLHAGSSLPAGAYTLNIGGTYMPWDGEEQAAIPEGVYTIDLTGLTASGIPPVVSDYVGPVFVKSTEPVVESSADGPIVTGRVVDKYVDYKNVLVPYGLDYDLNSKLNAKVQVVSGEEVVATEAVTLGQDGSFLVDLGEKLGAGQAARLIVEDAAGNSASTVIYTAPEEEEPVITVPDNELEEQLENKSSNEVVVNVPEFEGAAEVALTAAQISQIADAKKGLTVQSGDAGFVFDKKTVSQLSAAGDVTVALGKEDSAEENAISEVYSVHFVDAEGNNIDTGKQKVDVSIPVDLSGIQKTNKLTVSDSDSGKTYKLKVKGDIGTFKADGPGTFTAKR